MVDIEIQELIIIIILFVLGIISLIFSLKSNYKKSNILKSIILIIASICFFTLTIYIYPWMFTTYEDKPYYEENVIQINDFIYMENKIKYLSSDQFPDFFNECSSKPINYYYDLLIGDNYVRDCYDEYEGTINFCYKINLSEIPSFNSPINNELYYFHSDSYVSVEGPICSSDNCYDISDLNFSTYTYDVTDFIFRAEDVDDIFIVAYEDSLIKISQLTKSGISSDINFGGEASLVGSCSSNEINRNFPYSWSFLSILNKLEKEKEKLSGEYDAKFGYKKYDLQKNEIGKMISVLENYKETLVEPIENPFLCESDVFNDHIYPNSYKPYKRDQIPYITLWVPSNGYYSIKALDIPKYCNPMITITDNEGEIIISGKNTPGSKNTVNLSAYDDNLCTGVFLEKGFYYIYIYDYNDSFYDNIGRSFYSPITCSLQIHATTDDSYNEVIEGYNYIPNKPTCLYFSPEKTGTYYFISNTQEPYFEFFLKGNYGKRINYSNKINRDGVMVYEVELTEGVEYELFCNPSFDILNVYYEDSDKVKLDIGVNDDCSVNKLLIINTINEYYKLSVYRDYDLTIHPNNPFTVIIIDANSNDVLDTYYTNYSSITEYINLKPGRSYYLIIECLDGSRHNWSVVLE